LSSIDDDNCKSRADDEADQEIPGSGEQHQKWSDTHPHLCELTPSEKAVSDLLWALFAAPAALKLGFAFHNDLHQLVNSFPHLPVFQSLPVRLRTPRRVHAPVPCRARQQASLGVASDAPHIVAADAAITDSGVATGAGDVESVSTAGLDCCVSAMNAQSAGGSLQTSYNSTVEQEFEPMSDELSSGSELMSDELSSGSDIEAEAGSAVSDFTTFEKTDLLALVQAQQMNTERAGFFVGTAQRGLSNGAEIVSNEDTRNSVGPVQAQIQLHEEVGRVSALQHASRSLPFNDATHSSRDSSAQLLRRH
jgi:hypothetical protein